MGKESINPFNPRYVDILCVLYVTFLCVYVILVVLADCKRDVRKHKENERKFSYIRLMLFFSGSMSMFR
jgi:hypothetical protein